MRNLSGYVAAPLLAASLIAVAACGADDAGDDAGEDSTTQEASVEAEETASDEATTEETAGQDVDDRTAAGLLAITTAEAETGDGSAYSIDYSDDADTWEVELAFGSDGPVEVTVDAAGTAVVGTEAIDELDRDFERALEFALASGTPIGDAIELGVAETGGVLEEAELDDDGADAAWRVSTDVDGQVTDVWLDVFSGEVVPEPADD